MDRRQVLKTGGVALAGLARREVLVATDDAGGGEVLYNGIRLPQEWPPRLKSLPSEPVTPSYLLSPPAVIPIDVGRQLFVDDFLIEQTTLRRTFHQAEYHPATPVLKPDRAWEGAPSDGPTAMPFSDGCWYDPRDRLYKLWYMGGYNRSTCCATSTDGIHWEKPALDVRPGTNVVLQQPRDSSTVWLDHEERDPARRLKLFRSYRMEDRWGLYVHYSPDGIHWTEPVLKTGACGDRATVFYNPFRKVWVYSGASRGHVAAGGPGFTGPTDTVGSGA